MMLAGLFELLDHSFSGGAGGRPPFLTGNAYPCAKVEGAAVARRARDFLYGLRISYIVKYISKNNRLINASPMAGPQAVQIIEPESPRPQR